MGAASGKPGSDGGRSAATGLHPRCVAGDAQAVSAGLVYRPRKRSIDTGSQTTNCRAGRPFFLCPIQIQRDARFFPDPLRFDPERWLDAQREKTPRYAYFPFGRRTAIVHRGRLCHAGDDCCAADDIPSVRRLADGRLADRPVAGSDPATVAGDDRPDSKTRKSLIRHCPGAIPRQNSRGRDRRHQLFGWRRLRRLHTWRSPASCVAPDPHQIADSDRHFGRHTSSGCKSYLTGRSCRRRTPVAASGASAPFAPSGETRTHS